MAQWAYEPRGEARADLRVAKQTGDIANIALGDKARNLTVESFALSFRDPFDDASDEDETSEAELAELLGVAPRSRGSRET